MRSRAEQGKGRMVGAGLERQGQAWPLAYGSWGRSGSFGAPT